MSDLAQQIWRILRNALLVPFDANSEFFWPHLLGALLLALAVHVWFGRRPIGPFLRETFAARIWWHRSARADYGFYLVNGVLYLLLVGPWLLTVAGIAIPVRDGLVALFGPGPVFPGVGGIWLVAVIYTVMHFLGRDFGRWFGHWIQHRVPLLWEFHKAHHSAEVLVPLTNARAHPVDLIVMAICGNACVGLVAGIGIYLFSNRIGFWHVAGVNAILFAFDLLGSNLRHAPVWLSYGPVLEKWLISPAQHQIHHSVEPRHWHKNMGFVLAVWDRLFGTLYVPKGHEPITYGLGDGSERDYHGIWALYWQPVKRAWGRLFGAAPVATTRVDA